MAWESISSLVYWTRNWIHYKRKAGFSFHGYGKPVGERGEGTREEEVCVSTVNVKPGFSQNTGNS